MRLRYQPALDGLRAVAVLAVIAYHDEPSRLPGGFLGVDAFFVLSGCLRLGRGRRRVLAAAPLAGAAASTYLMAARFRAIDASRSYYGTDTRAHALLVGALLAILLAHRPVRTTIVRRAIAVGG